MRMPLPRRDRHPNAPVAKRPLPEGVFPDIAAAYEAHDPTCLSLGWFWLARAGGVSCPSDLEACSGCRVTFYREGVTWVNYADEDAEDEIRLCGCCATRRGYRPVLTAHGLTVHAAQPE